MLENHAYIILIYYSTSGLDDLRNAFREVTNNIEDGVDGVDTDIEEKIWMKNNSMELRRRQFKISKAYDKRIIYVHILYLATCR